MERWRAHGKQTSGVEGVMAQWQRREGGRRAYRAEVAGVGSAVPACHAGGRPVTIGDVQALAARPGFLPATRASGRRWTSRSRSRRHLCPVVVLDILSCFFIPPSCL